MTFLELYSGCDVERFPSASENDVQEFENNYLVSLPPHYRQFLLDYNGGCFYDARFTIQICSPFVSDRLDLLYGINAPICPLGSEISLFDNNNPVILLPIGSTAFNRLILIFTGPGDDDSIFMKDPFSDHIYRVADSIVLLIEESVVRHQ